MSYEHLDSELQKKLCYLYWDIANIPELLALSPSASHPTAIQYSSFLLSIVTCIMGFAGNIVVIFVTGFLRKKNKSQIWFLNLAIADFIFLLVVPLQAVNILTARWPYGSIMCKLYNFLNFTHIYASIYILTALNIDRALSVAKPIWHLRFLSRKFGYCVCTLIWVLSIICSIPSIFYSEEYYFGEEPQCILFPDDLTGIVYLNNDQNLIHGFRNFSRELCDEPFQSVQKFQDWIEMLSTTMQLVVPLAVFGCLIPLCVIISSNVTIALHVKNSQKASSSSRLYKVVIAAILVFFCTRTPLLLAQIIFLGAAYTLQFTLMYKVIVYMPLLISISSTNAFLNPVVYVLVGKQVRDEICQFLRKL
ncbi:chemokine-like receptor 1 [Bufo gargarizans]|uniref:chemokine-like receptor 1 n=1 Tax=Bufo gargarizans TaxID=30331 RepID=UPI001CF4C6E4|nr:chemokine-like receptor 1 [Bufo gargarizans]XP_044159763.1 chemokine-like receptor 1 [Bufo gargarizans]XP_044159765.1 chemokine-like receptor 1 [Bufo gargarizans]